MDAGAACPEVCKTEKSCLFCLKVDHECDEHSFCHLKLQGMLMGKDWKRITILKCFRIYVFDISTMGIARQRECPYLSRFIFAVQARLKISKVFRMSQSETESICCYWSIHAAQTESHSTFAVDL